MEDRVTPAVITLTAGTVTELQQDINTANTQGVAGDQYVINLQTGVNFDLNQLATANKTLDINSQASVQLAGTGNTITPANGQRAFKVESTAEFDNLTISGGKMTADPGSIGGAAIWDANGGNLTLNNVTVSNNTVYSAITPFVSAEGGGIYVNGNANLTINNSTITNNQALGTEIDGVTQVPGASVFGGGIYVNGFGTINISASTISNNLAQGGSNFGTARGGGMAIFGTANVRLTGVTADGDQAVGGGGLGGGLAFGGALDILGGTFALVGSTVKNSQAIGGDGSAGAGGSAFGGGVCVQSGANATILNSSLLSNTATGGKGTTVGGQAIGGGLDDFAATLNLLNSTLGQNIAQGGNGTQAGRATGGGLSVSAGGTVPEMFNDTVVFNKALSGAGTTAAAPNGGGGVFSNNAGGITMINSLVQANITNGTGPDALATFNAASSNNVFSNAAGIGGTVPGTVTPIVQVASTLTSGGTTSPSYYALLPNATDAINKGTVTSALNAITNAEFNFGVIPSNDPTQAVDEAGNPRTRNSAGLQIDIGAVQFNQALSSVTFGNFSQPSLSVPFGATSAPSFSVGVFDVNGQPITAGTIVASVVDSNGNPITGAGSVSVVINPNGTTTIPALTLPANLPVGSYSVLLQYTNSVTGLSGTGQEELDVLASAGTLSLNSVTPITASTASQTVSVTATVNGPSGSNPINDGSVVFTLTDNHGNVITFSAPIPVSNSTATTLFTVPANMAAGTYTITATYTGPNFATTPASTNLLINAASTAVTTVSVAPATILASNTSNQMVNVSAAVASNGSPVTQGTVTFVLLDSNGAQVGNVSSPIAVNSNGTASASLIVPSGTPPGSYHIQARYTDSHGVFANSDGSAALAVLTPPPPPAPPPPPPPPVVTTLVTNPLIALYVDAAWLVLDLHGYGPMFGLPTPPEILANIHFNLPLGGIFALPALIAGADHGLLILGSPPNT